MKLTVLAMLFIVGCHSAPVPYYANDIIPKDYYAEGIPTKADANKKFSDKEAGTKYCQRVATNADIRSQHYLFWGILGSVLASGAVLAGTAMGPDDDDDANWAQKNRNSIVLGSGALVAIPSTVFLMLSKNNAEASAGATAGLAESDDDSAKKMCIAARNRMVRSRIDVADYVKDRAQQNLNALETQEARLSEDIKTKRAALETEGISDEKREEVEKDILELENQRSEIVEEISDTLIRMNQGSADPQSAGNGDDADAASEGGDSGSIENQPPAPAQ